MALVGAITQLALYGGVGLPYPAVEAAPEPAPVVTTTPASGPSRRSSRDRTHYGYIAPRRWTLERELGRDLEIELVDQTPPVVEVSPELRRTRAERELRDLEVVLELLEDD